MTFYYIPTLNYVDTPIFENLKTQSDWFANKIVGKADIEGFYPPFYEPVLRVSTDEISFNTSSKPVNYMSVDYEGKTYYYFVNDISYVSENVVAITIDLDTIQTYLFEMQFTRGTIERKAIDRWNSGDTINRNYIRENLSSGESRIVNTQKYSNEYEVHWVAVKQTGGATTNATPNILNIDGKDVLLEQFGLGYYLFPIILHNGAILEDDIIIVGKYYNCKQTLSALAKYVGDGNSSILSVSYIPFDIFNGTFNGTSNTYSTDYYNIVSLTDLWGATGTLAIAFYYLGSIKSNTGFNLFTSNIGYSAIGEYYEKNTKKGVEYDIKYTPVLIDESYINCSIRFMGEEKTLPLRYFVKETFSVRLFSDLDSVLIVPIFGSYAKIEYNILGDYILSPLPQYPLLTNQWSEYNINHSGTLVSDVFATILGGGGSILRNISMTKAVESGSEGGTGDNGDYLQIGIPFGGYLGKERQYTTPTPFGGYLASGNYPMLPSPSMHYVPNWFRVYPTGFSEDLHPRDPNTGRFIRRYP